MVSDSVPPKWSAKMPSPLTRPNTGRHDYLDATCGAVPAGPRGPRPRSAPHVRSRRSPGAVGPPGPAPARGLPRPGGGAPRPPPPALDDGTGEAPAATFRDAEDAHGYFLVLRGLTQTNGVPVAAYSDRHGIFHRATRTPLTLQEQLTGKPAPTQVARALQELGIRWIPARSPQAKGRIERLVGTFQDRLRSEE